MQKKTFVQLILILTIVIIFIAFYKKYFYVQKTLNNIPNNFIKKESTANKTKSNLIHNIKYTSGDKGDDYYVIESEFGELNPNKPEIILMKGVQAKINFRDSSSIIISADNAIYNNISHNTNFYSNVLIAYTDHIIEAYKFDLNFEKNLGTISNNIIYKNLNTKLEADKIEIDLITKNSKIYMNEKEKKIKITNTE
jgi:lipopolysaccharide assembly outer membrane protein LptD (OstA)